MRRKALLINPGYYEAGDYGSSYMPPMGLLKIGRYLKNKGVDTSYLDCSIPLRMNLNNQTLKEFYTRAPFVKWAKCGNYENEGVIKPVKYYGMPFEIIKEKIYKANPTEIWLGSGLTYYWEAVRDVAEICKKVFPNVPLLLGGIYPTLYPDHANNNIPCDYMHQGPLDDIDDLLPDYDLDPSKKSLRTIQLGKGCNVNPPCTFCAVVAMDPKFKTLMPDKVFEYMKEEYAKGATFWQLWSSQLLVPPKRIKNLMNLIVNSDMNLSLTASEGVQPDLFTQEISDLMYQAGFISVSIPMESINPDKIAEYKKPSGFNDYERAVHHAQTSGFKTIKSFVMIGIPGQTKDEVIQSIVNCWARNTNVALHQYTPIPGSEDWVRFPQFHSHSPEELHPSLWPGASEDFKVSEMEEIKRITRVGSMGFMIQIRDESIGVRHRQIWDLFVKWCKEYGLLTSSNRPTYRRTLSLPGYKSEYDEAVEHYLKEKSITPKPDDVCEQLCQL